MATRTEQLRLFVYDTSVDGQLNFSVKDALSDNFKTIDANAKSVATSLSTINDNITNLQTHDTTLDGQIVSLNNDIRNINSDITDINTKFNDYARKDQIASNNDLGMVKIGENITLASDGTISVETSGSGIDEDEVRRIIKEYLATVSGKQPGELMWSLEPMSDSNLLMLNGSKIATTGSYKEFIDTYIKPLENTHPERFKTETEWQAINNAYNTCSYYVLNESDNTLRLPNLCGMVEITTDDSKGGVITAAGLPLMSVSSAGKHKHKPGTMNITGSFNGNTNDDNQINGAFYYTGESASGADGSEDAPSGYIGFDASRNWTGETSEEGEHTHIVSWGTPTNTVQPQTTKIYCYIVASNKLETDVSIMDISRAARDISTLYSALSGKKGIKEDSSEDEDTTNGYIIFDTDMVIQWGLITSGTNLLTFPVPFINTNYVFFINPFNSGTFTYSEVTKTATSITFNRGTTSKCYWLAIGIRNYDI